LKYVLLCSQIPSLSEVSQFDSIFLPLSNELGPLFENPAFHEECVFSFSSPQPAKFIPIEKQGAKSLDHEREALLPPEIFDFIDLLNP